MPRKLTPQQERDHQRRADAWRIARAYRKHHFYRNLYVETIPAREKPTVQIWFEVELDGHQSFAGAHELLQKLDDLVDQLGPEDGHG